MSEGVNHWFKFWASAREDAKLRALSDFEFRYWVCLLCLAAEDAGTVDTSDPEGVCVEIGLLDKEVEPDVERLEKLLQKLERRRLISVKKNSLTFSGWERRQMKPSDRPEATRERKRRQREKQRSESSVTPEVTPPVTRDVTPTEDRRQKTEKEKGGYSGLIQDGTEEIAPPVDKSFSLPDCLTREVANRTWTALDGSQHATAAGAFWSDLQAERGASLMSESERGTICAIVASCPEHCTGETVAEVSSCLDVLSKAAQKTHGRPTPLFRKIVEEDR